MYIRYLRSNNRPKTQKKCILQQSLFDIVTSTLQVNNHFMRTRFILIALFTTTAALAAGTPSVEKQQTPLICNVYPAYHATADFDSLSEFFSGKENPRGQYMLRSQPTERAGLYLRITLDKPLNTLPNGTLINIYYQRSDSAKPLSHTFELSDTHQKTSTLLLGLTGTDWPISARLNAWKVDIISRAGSLIGTLQSHVWSLPENQASVEPTPKAAPQPVAVEK